MACQTLGNVYDTRGDYPKALEYLLEGLRAAEALGNRKYQADHLDSIGSVYSSLGDYPKAREYHTSALRLFRESEEVLLRCRALALRIKDEDTVAETHLHLSILRASQGNFEQALRERIAYEKIREELVNPQTRKQVAELREKYEAEKRTREIELLKRDNDLLKKADEIRGLELSRARLQTQLLVVAAAVVLLVIFLLLRKYRHLLVFWKKKNFVGHYRILDKLGSGGMGSVYRAHHVMEKSRAVALKVIREDLGRDETLRKRFVHEAAVVDQLDHPHVVKVYERGEHQDLLFIAMELLQGRTLAEWIQAEGPLPVPEAVSILRQLTDALARIHARQIVHRDLKPENIMLTEVDGDRNFVKIMDFGLARTQSMSRLTETGMIVGTVNYLPPEQIARQEYTAAGDLYALGVIAYEMVTGRKPFVGETCIELFRQILDHEPLEPDRLREGLPPALNALILRLMAKRPEDRPDEETILGVLDGEDVPLAETLPLGVRSPGPEKA